MSYRTNLAIKKELIHDLHLKDEQVFVRKKKRTEAVPLNLNIVKEKLLEKLSKIENSFRKVCPRLSPLHNEDDPFYKLQDRPSGRKLFTTTEDLSHHKGKLKRNLEMKDNSGATLPLILTPSLKNLQAQ